MHFIPPFHTFCSKTHLSLKSEVSHSARWHLFIYFQISRLCPSALSCDEVVTCWAVNQKLWDCGLFGTPGFLQIRTAASFLHITLWHHTPQLRQQIKPQAYNMTRKQKAEQNPRDKFTVSGQRRKKKTASCLHSESGWIVGFKQNPTSQDAPGSQAKINTNFINTKACCVGL